MSRVAVRTARLTLDDVNRMVGLFGSIKNVHRCLGLEGEVDYNTVYRAFQDQPIAPVHRDLIEAAWSRWRALFLRDEVPQSDDLAVTFSNRDQWPAWHPYGETPEEDE